MGRGARSAQEVRGGLSRATAVSSAPRVELEKIHEPVLSHNMVLGALRGIPQTNELVTVPARAHATTTGAVPGI